MSRTEAKQWLADALGKSGEAAEHVVFYRGRHAGLEPRQLRAAKRELGVTDYQGGPQKPYVAIAAPTTFRRRRRAILEGTENHG
jgi:hypothetical protein